MHTQTIEQCRHQHDFAIKNKTGERRTLYVLLLTAVTMVLEITAGSIYGSMALLADGWHMGTHVAAFFITLYAYRYSRKHANNPAFAFGTGKVNILGGFASAIALAMVALVMLIESIQRIIEPQTIHFNEAILVACIGLSVNIISAWMLKDDHSHHHSHHHDHQHSHHQHNSKKHHSHDHNLRAAYFHVLADALTSLFAIIALILGKYFGWHWMDPIMGIVGGIIIIRWSLGLLRQTSPILLDASISPDYLKSIKEDIEQDADNRISDLHVWKVGANDYGVIISIVTHFPKSAEYYKSLIKDYEQLSHVTIEVNQCNDPNCESFNSKPS